MKPNGQGSDLESNAFSHECHYHDDYKFRSLNKV